MSSVRFGAGAGVETRAQGGISPSGGDVFAADARGVGVVAGVASPKAGDGAMTVGVADGPARFASPSVRIASAGGLAGGAAVTGLTVAAGTGSAGRGGVGVGAVRVTVGAGSTLAAGVTGRDGMTDSATDGEVRAGAGAGVVTGACGAGEGGAASRAGEAGRGAGGVVGRTGAVAAGVVAAGGRVRGGVSGAGFAPSASEATVLRVLATGARDSSVDGAAAARRTGARAGAAVGGDAASVGGATRGRRGGVAASGEAGVRVDAGFFSVSAVVVAGVRRRGVGAGGVSSLIGQV